MIMSMLFIGFIIVFILISQIFLDDYYIYKFEDQLLDDMFEFESNKDTSLESQLSTIRELSKTSGFKYLLVDQEGKILLSSVPEFAISRTKADSIDRDTQEIINSLSSEEYAYDLITFESKEQRVVMVKKVQASYLIISTQLSEIIEHAKIANEFFIWTSIILLIIIILLIYFLSKRVVSPILTLNNQVKHIADFDFSLYSDIKTKDELGQLGQNINRISRALEERINSLNSHNKILKDDMEHQRRFLASIAHEFKSPVGIIKGYAESIKLNYYKDEKEKNEFVDYIVEESDRLTDLVEDIIMLAQLDNKQFALNCDSINLSKHLLDYIQKHKIEVQEISIEESLYVKGDKRRINQVLSNLFQNALRYKTEQGYITVSLKQTSLHVQLSVSNDCEPITKEDLSQLIKPFYRIEASRSRHTGGHGLGLSIINSIVEAHEGEMSLSYKNGFFEVQVKFKR